MSNLVKTNNKFHFVNIGWACTDVKKESNAQAYAISASSKLFDEIGNLVKQFRYATIKRCWSVTMGGVPAKKKTGYGRMIIMYSSDYVQGSIEIANIKTTRGEYLLP